ncbi:MAG: protein kinase [Phormidesmis sp.]
MAYCFNPVCPQPQNPSTARFCQACGTALRLDERYRLMSLLGQGGFGRTFLAETVDTGADNRRVAPMPARQCVIKQINKSALANASGFRAEADRLRKLGEHPQIPRLFDAFENDSGQFLVQEFAPGENLQKQVADKGPWDEGEVRSLLKSLVAILQYVHSFQIIHRDIKPENIVSQPGGSPVLVDFGSAKWVRQTPAKTVIGSAGYASPEQSMGQATFASDIYSLGLTCLYLLTGVHPFGLYSAAEDRWVWQDYLASPIDPKLAQVLDKMVARSLQQRYESMDQVDLDLKSSQNVLITGSQQLLDQAKKSMPGLKSFLKTTGNVALPKPQAMTRKLPTDNRSKPKLITTATQSWKRSHRLAPDIGLTQALAVSPNGQLMVSGGLDGAVHLWDLPSAQLIHTFPRRRLMGDGHRSGITALAFHPDGRALYSASEDGTVKEWDIAERRLLNTLPAPGWTPTDVLVTPDGTQLMSANRDGKIVVWEIASLLPVAQLTQHQQCVNAITFSPNSAHDAGLLASASDDGTVKLWKRTFQEDQLVPLFAKSIALSQGTSTGKGIGRKGGGKSRAIALALRPTAHFEQQLIVATEHTVLLYHLDTYLEVSAPTVLCQSEALISAIALSKKTASSDALLAVGTENRVLTLWQIETGDCVAQLAHDWGVGAIAFTPDGQTLIAASDDEVISIWHSAHRPNF